MNLIHLKYALEVDKTRSISKAAENLFMGQPNLSRAIKELEESLGITIFKRTSKGIIPTPKGEEFLMYARNIMEQVNEMEAMYNNSADDKQTFSISIPRASYIADAFTKFIRLIDVSKPIEFYFKETNSMRAINNILQENFNLAIIRYQTDFEHYFLAMLNEKGLKYRDIREFVYLSLMSVNHPLAYKEDLDIKELSQYIEIVHGDPYVPSMPIADVKKAEFSDLVNKRIFIYERGSQFDLLCNVPQTYMWVSPMPGKTLERYGLVQKKCKSFDRRYKDILVFRKDYRFTELDNLFLKELYKSVDETEI